MPVEPRSRPAFAGLRRGRHGCRYSCGGMRVACETGYSYHLVFFFPPTAVGDILGEGDKWVVELVA